MQQQNLTSNETLKTFVVAVDGPAGSGKTTTARLVARELGFRHIDTGAMYRAVTFLALRSGIDPADGERLATLARKVDITFSEAPEGGQTVRANGEEVTKDIRSPEVTKAVSPVSAHPGVRRAMVLAQRRLASKGGAVLEGRDIGTVVLPDAEVKIYLVASARIRAQRRIEEIRAQGVDVTLDQVEADIIRRDKFDSERETSPLRPAVGAIEVDTSALTIDEQVTRVLSIARETAERLTQLISRPGTRSQVRRIRPHYRLGQMFIYLVMKVVFGLKVYKKLEEDYEENYIYACNHLAYADPPFVGSTFPREVYFLAKESLFRNPVFGWLIRAFNAIPMRRGVFDREAMNIAVDHLRNNRSLMIFPEGGRVFGGKLGSAKSGVGYLAINSGVAVIPVYVCGTDRLWGCFWGRARLRVSQGRPIRLPVNTLEACKNRDSYRLYGDMVMTAIATLRDELETPL